MVLTELLGTGWFSKEIRVLGLPSEPGVLASNSEQFPWGSQRVIEKESHSSWVMVAIHCRLQLNSQGSPVCPPS